MELEGKKGLFVTGQSRRTSSVATVYHVWPLLLGFGAVLGQKRLFWGTKCELLGGHLPTWRPRPGGATGEFWAQSLDSARAPPRLYDG